MAHLLQKNFSPEESLEVNRPGRMPILALLVLALLGLLGCNVGPKYIRPAVPAPSAFKESGPQQAPDGTVWKPAQPQDAMLRGNWWETYQYPALNSLDDKFTISTHTTPLAFDTFMS